MENIWKNELLRKVSILSISPEQSVSNKYKYAEQICRIMS